MNNILLVEKYLAEIKTLLANFIHECEQFNLPYDAIIGVLELLVCIDNVNTQAKEVYDLIFIQLPELYHCKTAMDFVDNVCQLFSGGMNELLTIENSNFFISVVKNVFQEEMNRLEYYRNRSISQGEDGDLLAELENINLK